MKIPVFTVASSLSLLKDCCVACSEDTVTLTGELSGIDHADIRNADNNPFNCQETNRRKEIRTRPDDLTVLQVFPVST